MIRRPPRSTRTDTLFPYTTLFRSTVLPSTTPKRRTALRQAQGKRVLGLPTDFPERPIHRAARPQRPPDDQRLRGETRAVIPPAERFAADGDAGKCVVEVRGPDAQRIEREAPAGALARRGDPQADRRSEERRVGKGWVRTCRTRWAPDH